MKRPRRPTVTRVQTANGPRPDETLVEIHANDGTWTGCLLSIRRDDDGSLRLYPYRSDGDVFVADGPHTWRKVPA